VDLLELAAEANIDGQTFADIDESEIDIKLPYIAESFRAMCVW